jgi:hypothetical protein
MVYPDPLPVGIHTLTYTTITHTTTLASEGKNSGAGVTDFRPSWVLSPTAHHVWLSTGHSVCLDSESTAPYTTAFRRLWQRRSRPVINLSQHACHAVVCFSLSTALHDESCSKTVTMSCSSAAVDSLGTFHFQGVCHALSLFIYFGFTEKSWKFPRLFRQDQDQGQAFLIKTKTKTKTLSIKTKTKTKTFISVLEEPRDQDLGLEDYISDMMK